MSPPSPPTSPSDAFAAQCPALPENGKWRIEMRSRDIGNFAFSHYGHSYIAVVDPTGKSALEFHGFNKDPVTGESKPGSGNKGDLLGVAMVPGAWPYFADLPAAGTTVLAEDTIDNIRDKIKVLTATAQAINNEKLAYKGYGILESGQNCNSVVHTLARALGHDKDPQLMTEVVLIGSSRLLPTPALDLARLPDGSVDPQQIDTALSLYATAHETTSITIPDTTAMLEGLSDSRCQPLDLETGIDVDGLKFEGSLIDKAAQVKLAQPKDQTPITQKKDGLAAGF